MTKEEMQELRSMMVQIVKPIEEKVDNLQKDMVSMKENMVSMKEDMAAMKEDVAVIKDEAKRTRHSVNLLLTWAEKADRSLNVGLYEKH